MIAKVCINDVLVAIEGKPCSGLSSEIVSCLLAGPRGSFIKVRVQRDRLQHDLILRRDFALGQTGASIISPESVPHAGPQPPEHAYSTLSREPTGRPKLRGILKASDDDVLSQASAVWTDSGSFCPNTGRRAFKISASNVLNGTARERASTSSKPLHTVKSATSVSHSVHSERSETRGSAKTTESASVMASASAPGLARLGPLLRSGNHCRYPVWCMRRCWRPSVRLNNAYSSCQNAECRLFEIAPRGTPNLSKRGSCGRRRRNPPSTFPSLLLWSRSISCPQPRPHTRRPVLYILSDMQWRHQRCQNDSTLGGSRLLCRTRSYVSAGVSIYH